MKLLSMTKFVLDQFRQLREKDLSNIYLTAQRIEYYAKFLEQPLTLGMFVPCDADGNVLEEPEDYKDSLLSSDEYSKLGYVHCNEWHVACAEYQEAKDRVLFEGWNFSYDFPGTITILDNYGKYLGMHKSDYRFRIADSKGDKLALLDIESLVNNSNFEIYLTESAKKQIGL